jgi:hypothetical protein
MTFAIDPLRSEPDPGSDFPAGTIWKHAVALVEGRVVDAKLDALAGGVFVVIDESTVTRGLYGYERAPLAASSNASLRRCGFKVRFRTEPLELGRHSFRIIAVSADGSAYDESDERTFELTARPEVPSGELHRNRRTAARFERAFTSLSDGVVPPNGRLRVEQGRNVHVTGWAVDEPNRAAGKRAALLVDDSIVFAAFYGGRRDDVARRLGNPDFSNCGFAGAIATADLAPGEHSACCLLQSADGSWLAGSDELSFEVTPAG